VPARTLLSSEQRTRLFAIMTGTAEMTRHYLLDADDLALVGELLGVLERPEIPLHTNGPENDIRCHVTRRKVSAGTRSDDGRDAFLGVAKTCAKRGVAFWDYLDSRLSVPGYTVVPHLSDLIRCPAQSA
jgi:hypothetical protein